LKVIEEVLLRWKLRACFPLNHQLTRSRSCLVLRLGYDTNEVFADNDLGEAWKMPD
jgi:hypothetical protein